MQAGRSGLIAAVLIPTWLLVPCAWGTNGMNMEAYGPIAGGMGGAATAVENGSAAMMSNPATIGMMEEGYRLDLALGRLGPDVSATVDMGAAGSMKATSKSTAFYMPAIGFLARSGRFGFGVGAFVQGGMGTEYGRRSWMADPSMGADTALQEPMINRSELGVARVMMPLTCNVRDDLTIGGTIDYVHASLDLQMAMSEAQFVDMANPAARRIGSVSGSLANAFGMLYEPFGGNGIERLYFAAFDFSDDNAFTGSANASGVAGKLGVVYQFLPQFVTFGASWQSKTSLGDLETSDAELIMGVSIDSGIAQGGAPSGTYIDADIPVTGKLSVVDFQWPQSLAFGLAIQPYDEFLFAFDVHRIYWADVMKDFRMRFTAADVPANGNFAGLDLDAVLFQDWKDQTVIAFGGAYQVSDPLVLRAGLNFAKDPIPDALLNALFPAIVENHITFGAGYEFLENQNFDLSATIGLTKEATNPGFGTPGEPGYVPPVTSKHGQFNLQFMYSARF